MHNNANTSTRARKKHNKTKNRDPASRVTDASLRLLERVVLAFTEGVPPPRPPPAVVIGEDGDVIDAAGSDHGSSSGGGGGGASMVEEKDDEGKRGEGDGGAWHGTWCAQVCCWTRAFCCCCCFCACVCVCVFCFLFFLVGFPVC